MRKQSGRGRPEFVEGPGGGADQPVVGIMGALVEETPSPNQAGDGAADWKSAQAVASSLKMANAGSVKTVEKRASRRGHVSAAFHRGRGTRAAGRCTSSETKASYSQGEVSLVMVCLLLRGVLASQLDDAEHRSIRVEFHWKRLTEDRGGSATLYLSMGGGLPESAKVHIGQDGEKSLALRPLTEVMPLRGLSRAKLALVVIILLLPAQGLVGGRASARSYGSIAQSEDITPAHFLLGPVSPFVTPTSDATTSERAVRPHPAGTPVPQAFIDRTLNTLVLSNNTIVKGNYIAQDEGMPQAVVCNGTSGEVFVANSISESVSVLTPTSNQLIANFSLGYTAQALTVDTGKGVVFAAQASTDRVGVFSEATGKAITNITVGSSPDAVAYDPAAGEVFVANGGSANVSVINDTSDRVVGTIAVGTTPDALAIDTAKGEVFVGNDGSNTVSVITVSNRTVIAQTSVGTGPASAAFDSGTGEVFVATPGTRNVSVISDATNKVVANFSSGPHPISIAYDPSRHAVLVVDYFNDVVSAVSDTTYTILGSVNTDIWPTSVCVDPRTGEAVVANSETSTLTVISSSSYAVAATVPIGIHPMQLAYDSARGELFVANQSGAGVVVVSTSTGKVVKVIPTLSNPFAVAYDPVKGEIFVSDVLAGDISVISDSTDNLVANISSGGFGPEGIAYDSQKGELFVSCIGGGISVINVTTEAVVARIGASFGEQGIVYDPGTGEIYAVNQDYNNVSVINDTTNKVVSNIAVGTYPNEWMAYDPAQGEIFVSNTGSSNVSVISDTLHKVVASIPLPADPTGISYDPAQNAIVVGHVVNSTPVVSYLSDTTYASLGSVDIGYGDVYQAYDPSNGNIYIDNYYGGTITSVGPIHNATFPVIFTETGIPSGTSWSVTLGGVTNSSAQSIGFVEPNGSYVYTVGSVIGYAATPSSGIVNVTGASITVQIHFSVVSGATYPVTFQETGFTPGATWQVNLNGTVLSSSTSTIIFHDRNGSYAFSVGPLNNFWRVVPTSGLVTVSGLAVSVTVTITYVYPLTFEAPAGVPNGTMWSVVLSGTGAGFSASNPDTSITKNSTGPSIVFYEPNGTYAFSITVTGYPNYDYTGTVTIAGGSVHVTPAPLTSISLTSVSVNPSSEVLQVGTSVNFTATPVCTGGPCPGSGLTYAWSLSDNTMGTLSTTAGPSTLFRAGSRTGSVILYLEVGLNGKTVWSNTSLLIHVKPTPSFLGLPGLDGYFLIEAIAAAAATIVIVLTIKKLKSRAPVKTPSMGGSEEGKSAESIETKEGTGSSPEKKG